MPGLRSRKREVVMRCTNHSTVVTETDFLRYLTAQQRQLDGDFAEEWDLTCKLTTSATPGLGAATLGAPTSGAGLGSVATLGARAAPWQLVILDDSDQAGALGYHDDVVGINGQPLAKVFAKTDQEHGYNWTVTASHEVLETLADPDINRLVMVETHSAAGFVLVAYEVCDPCEADSLGRKFRVGGVDVQLSDFVTRAWFEPATPAGPGAFSAYGHLNRPLEVAEGGYIGVFTPGRGWNQQVAFGQEARPAPGRHARLEDSPRRLARFSRRLTRHTG